MVVDELTESQNKPEQFRMSKLQVYNWGTFSDIHEIPIPEKGFLFVGKSGAGKSTLLDAFSALLVPPRWVAFNAAARDTSRSNRDRNLASYIRGAWADQEDQTSGTIATQYLRSGTTWSALALTYKNGLDQIVVLVQLLWLRGSACGPKDVNRQYLIFNRDFHINELQVFGQSNLDVRKLKQHFEDAFIRKEFRPYCERFCRLLGIENEMALRLLHKTQSAKNLGDLNVFLREFMLDRPATFEVADRLVDEFGELNAAHQAVVTARKQVETLSPAKDHHKERLSLLTKVNRLQELLLSVDSYQGQRRIGLLKKEIIDLGILIEGLKGEIQTRETTLENHKNNLEELKNRHYAAGGGQLENLKSKKKDLENQRDERLHKREQAKQACRGLDVSLPDSPYSFAELVGGARQELERWEGGNEDIRAERDKYTIQKQEAEKSFTRTVKEVQVLERQPSNIPSHMLELRESICEAIGISETALPFVGELIEVKKEESSWQGAIERVLHGFALSLLVDERHYSALTNHVNSSHLGQRLVYYRTTRSEYQQTKPVDTESLVLKLNIKECSYAQWLQFELRKRFDYTCVDSIRAFKSAERALTQEGQVKHSQTRHEKDDRRKTTDRRFWCLGFNNLEKLAIYRRQAQKLAETVSQFEQRIKILDDKEKVRSKRAMDCQTLVNLQWKEIDVSPLLSQIDELQRRIKDILEGNAELEDLVKKITQHEKYIKEADEELRESLVNCRGKEQRRDEYEQQVNKLEEDPNLGLVTPQQKKELDERFDKQSNIVTLENLESLARKVQQNINNEIGDTSKSIADCEKYIEKRFDEFIRLWPTEAEGLDASLEAAPDFFTKLTRLVSDGLPAHEQRFFELLESQSHQNLAALSTYLSDARKEIIERLELVNESLSQVPFNQSVNQTTYLSIDSNDRQLPEVTSFKQEIQHALSHAWSENRELAEERFITLRGLVEKLSSEEPKKKWWKQLVLDVRLHLEFIGREIDEGDVQIEVYRGGSNKSGGQQQKLATTCLAAALRYQLGGNERGVPIYAPVVLDEAFDKADNEFTALAMNIFVNFGFQMIVATPLKSVMTLEPFIGGACYIDIKDRRISGALMIEYDTSEQRLDLPSHISKEVVFEDA